MISRPAYALALHGGAGPTPGRDYGPVEAHLAELIRKGQTLLDEGGAALDVVEAMVADMELSGLYVAGRGSAANASGVVEMDASIMDGASGRAGAVTAVRDLVHPVKAARAVMDHTPHILLAGDGADRFCIEQGLERTTGRSDWYRLPIGVELQETLQDELAHGTVGAVAMDRAGRLAAATSTGGLFGKRAGRVGDTPLIGCGTWADERVAISCTGLGEFFILNSAAYDIAARMKYGEQSLSEASDQLLMDVKRLGGDGGLIGLSAEGEMVLPFNSHGMKRAWVTSERAPQVQVF